MPRSQTHPQNGEVGLPPPLVFQGMLLDSLAGPLACQPFWELASTRAGGLAASHTNLHTLQLTISYHDQHSSVSNGSLDAMGSIARVCQSEALTPGPSSAPDWLGHCWQFPAPLWASVAPCVQWMG